MLILMQTVLTTLLAVSTVNPHFEPYIGNWGCTPVATTGTRAFTMNIKEVNGTTLGIQGRNIFPGQGRAQQYHTLTRSEDGVWTFDKGLVPYPYSGRANGSGTIIFERPGGNQDRLYWQLSPDGQTLRFAPYKTTSFQTEIQNHMVTCQRA